MKIAGPLALALLLGLIGGAAFVAMGLPLPWLLGAMLTTTAASMAGLRPAVPGVLRSPMIAVLGVLLGSGFSMELMAGAYAWLPTIASLPLYVVIVGGAGFVYLRLVTGLDPRTAYFAATPGGLGEIVAMSERNGGDVRRIALLHSVRILLIVLVVPFLVDHIGGTPIDRAPTDQESAAVDPLELLLLLGCAAAGYGMAARLKLPAAALLGPMVLSAAARMSGLVEHPPPDAVIALAQLVIGAGIGARFSAFTLAEVLRTMLAGLGLVMVMFVTTVAYGYGLHLVTGTPPLLLFLALAPGGAPEMSLVALALGIEPAFVATHHIIRIALVVALVPVFLKRVEPGQDPLVR